MLGRMSDFPGGPGVPSIQVAGISPAEQSAEQQVLVHRVAGQAAQKDGGAESAERPRGESGDGSRGESAEGRGPKSGADDVRGDEASSELRDAVSIVVVISEVLAGVDGGQKAVVLSDVIKEVASLLRRLADMADRLEKGGSISAGQACSVVLQVEMVREGVKEEAEKADPELRKVLEGVLRKLGRVGQKLLSMSLHLFPVREWSLGGEVSALFVKGRISVTFGK
jgi:hypothetical protein